MPGQKQRLKEKEKEDDEFKLNWTVAKDWSVESRYEYQIDQRKAKDLYQAVTDENSGILTWLKKFW